MSTITPLSSRGRTPTRAQTDRCESHYDRPTIALHWLTAGLVVALFLLAEGWGFFPRDIRRAGQALHISLRILLAAVVAARLLWRGTGGRRLPPATAGLQHWTAKAAHLALYGLLVAQVVLGFLYRWAQGEPFLFFGLFSIPSPFVFEPGMARTFGGLHNTVAWIIVVLAGLHAAAALIHHHVLRDGVLRRMLARGAMFQSALEPRASEGQRAGSAQGLNRMGAGDRWGIRPVGIDRKPAPVLGAMPGRTSPDA